jgi:hypothetical protein
MESFLAPTFITHAVHCKVDRETGVVRVLDVAAVHESGRVLNPIGANGQVEGGVVMGIGMATLEGSLLGEDARQLNPHLLDYKLQTASDSPPIHVATKPGGGENGSAESVSRPCVPQRAPTHAIAPETGARVHQPPMPPGRVWGGDEPGATRPPAVGCGAICWRRGRGAARSPAAPTWWRRPAARRAAGALVAIHAVRAARNPGQDGGLGARWTHADIVADTACELFTAPEHPPSWEAMPPATQAPSAATS